MSEWAEFARWPAKGPRRAERIGGLLNYTTLYSSVNRYTIDCGAGLADLLRVVVAGKGKGQKSKRGEGEGSRGSRRAGTDDTDWEVG